MRRIGVLEETAQDDKERNSQFAKFREGLAGFGWVEGRTVHIEHRFAAADADRYQPLAKELVALQPEVILAVSTPVTAALQRQTSTIPIVFLGVSDPIGSGFAANLARPGSNLTGIMLYEEGIAGKWLAMLKEIAPSPCACRARRRTQDNCLRLLRAECAGRGIRRPPSRLSRPRSLALTDIERGIEAFSRAPNGGLLLPTDGTTIVQPLILVIALAARHNLPAVYALRFLRYRRRTHVIWHPTSVRRSNRRLRSLTASYEAPNQSTFRCRHLPSIQTSLNLKTAKALGLAVPPGLLVAADEVIE